MTKNELKRYNNVLEENRRYNQALVELQSVRAAKTMLEIQFEQMKQAHEHDKKKAKLDLDELEIELKFAKTRMQQALDIAENAAGSVNSVTRLLGHTSDLVMSLEVKLNNMNKDEARRVR
jgi:hypothetical protein